MDSEMIKQGIIDYIQENMCDCFDDVNENIVVENKGNDYTAICTYYKQGYAGDVRGRIIITFRDVADASGDYPYDDDLWYSAYVDVSSCKIDTINTVHTEDLQEFAKFAKSMYKCLHGIYYILPNNENERYYFYVRQY